MRTKNELNKNTDYLGGFWLNGITFTRDNRVNTHSTYFFEVYLRLNKPR